MKSGHADQHAPSRPATSWSRRRPRAASAAKAAASPAITNSTIAPKCRLYKTARSQPTVIVVITPGEAGKSDLDGELHLAECSVSLVLEMAT